MDLSRIKSEIKSEYKYRLELHAHSKPASSCADIEPEKVVDIFADSGYSGIAITNHFYYGMFKGYYLTENKDEVINKYLTDYHRAAEEGEKRGVKVYLGAELRWDNISNNDYLLYGIDEGMLRDIFDYIRTDPETFVRECKSEKSFFIQAHPFRDHCSPLNAELLDGVEVFNMHPHHNSRVSLAARFADENGKIRTIGTDYHHNGHHNLCATRMKDLPEDSFALAAALKTGDFIPEIGGSIIL